VSLLVEHTHFWTVTVTLPFISAVLFFSLSPGYEVDSVHETPDPVDAVRKAEGIFIGMKY